MGRLHSGSCWMMIEIHRCNERDGDGDGDEDEEEEEEGEENDYPCT